ncbi:hypothetical protein B0O99DRAFT_611338 [Bisporella sp. PMI_857]|nr:hypothetical protein B0O99DRAFT_611338 [Bisporella sp. PMI_857]
MAANDYYNSHPQQSHSQYQAHNPYQSQGLNTHEHTDPSPVSSIQPQPFTFDGPFDDHVYPMKGNSSHIADSSSTLGANGRYYGAGGRQESQNSFADDIPLRDHPQVPSKDTTTDHVYDAPTSAAQPHILEEGRKRRSGLGGFMKSSKKRIPWVVYVFTLVQSIVFIVEIVKNAQLTGSPIEIHPSFNPMIGPSPWVLINMGARYVPCMHNVDEIQGSTTAISWGCPNTTDSNVAECSLSELCGFNGVPNPNCTGEVCSGKTDQKPEPNQWFRFIVPIFLHAGIIHIGFNMLLQLTLGREMEIAIGPIRFFLVYISAGIFGFVLGGNFAASGIASTGASGSLFGILALTLLDLLYTWGERRSPWKDLAFIALDVIISFVLGLLPGLDNFSHIGGFLMGLVLGICILHSPNALRKRIDQDEPPYHTVRPGVANEDVTSFAKSFAKSPLGFFKGRKPAWWAWWLVRAVSLVVVFIVFILLLNNFYVTRSKCSWCKYLSCIDVNGWCEIGNIKITNPDSKNSTSTTAKRSVFDTWEMMAQLYDA